MLTKKIKENIEKGNSKCESGICEILDKNICCTNCKYKKECSAICPGIKETSEKEDYKTKTSKDLSEEIMNIKFNCKKCNNNITKEFIELCNTYSQETSKEADKIVKTLFKNIEK